MRLVCTEGSGPCKKEGSKKLFMKEDLDPRTGSFARGSVPSSIEFPGPRNKPPPGS
jgi:hypothetical protein